MEAGSAGVAGGSAGDVAGEHDGGSVEDRADLDPARILMVNSFLPGTAQIALGHERTGRRILAASLSLNLIGTGLVIWDLLATVIETSGGYGIYKQDGKTYLLPPGESQGLIGSNLRLDAGLLLSTWGSAVSAYSQWAAARELFPRRDIGADYPTFGELLKAPYQAEHVFTWDVFPFFPTTIIGQLDWEDVQRYGRYFSRESVDLWGWEVNPWAGLAFNTMFAFALVHANAAAEEIVYRGIQLESRGVVRSSLSFGAAHLPNMLFPGVSVEDTVLQTVFATLFGFYAADRTRANTYDFRRMVALHFWHNIAAFTLGYLEQPANPAISWNIQVQW